MFYRGKRRLKREPDVFQKTFSGMFARLRGSGMLLSLLLVGLLVLVVAAWVAAERSNRHEAEAQAGLVAAMKQTDPRARAEELQKLAEQYRGTLAAPAALLVDAAMLHTAALRSPAPERERQLKASLEKLDRLLAGHPDHPLAPMARERRALVLEDLGDYEKAAAAFADAVRATGNTEFSYLKGKLLYGQARCQEKLKQHDAAILNLEQALAADSEYRESPWRPSASALLAQLRPAPKDLLVQGTDGGSPSPKEPDSKQSEGKGANAKQEK